MVEVAHCVPGRVRLSVASLRGRRDVCERIAHRLANESNLDRVAVRPITGSVIAEQRSPGLDAKDLARRLERMLEDESGDQKTPGEGDGWTAGGSRLARALVVASRGIDEDVRRALGGEADLRSLLPLALVALSAAEVSISGRLAAVPWSSLVWYAVRSFITFNAPAIHRLEKTGATTDRESRG